MTDLGPEGGAAGGRPVVAAGSHTGVALAAMLARWYGRMIRWH